MSPVPMHRSVTSALLLATALVGCAEPDRSTGPASALASVRPTGPFQFTPLPRQPRAPTGAIHSSRSSCRRATRR